MTDPKVVSQTVIAQLGGNLALSMIGATKVVYNQREDDVDVNVHFKAKARKVNGKSPNIVRITYVSASDLYEVTFVRIHGTTITELETLPNVFCDQLIPIFEETTGLYLTL